MGGGGGEGKWKCKKTYSLDGAFRGPIAHTGGPVLEVPITYQSYNELAEEFDNLISNKEIKHGALR